jgi:hypothetical protein
VVASSSDVQPSVIASASHTNQQQKSRSSIFLCQLILALGFEEKSMVDGAIAMALNTKSCSHLLLPVVCPCAFDKVQFWLRDYFIPPSHLQVGSFVPAVAIIVKPHLFDLSTLVLISVGLQKEFFPWWQVLFAFASIRHFCRAIALLLSLNLIVFCRWFCPRSWHRVLWSTSYDSI